MNEQDDRRVPDPQRPREKQHGPGQRREREQPLRDLDELATIEAIGQSARVDREEQERHPVADDGEPRERRRVERPELRARRGPRSEQRRSTHWGDYNPCCGYPLKRGTT